MSSSLVASIRASIGKLPFETAKVVWELLRQESSAMRAHQTEELFEPVAIVCSAYRDIRVMSEILSMPAGA